MGTKIEAKFVLDLLTERARELRDAAAVEAIAFTRTEDPERKIGFMQYEYGANLLSSVATDIDDHLVGR